MKQTYLLIALIMIIGSCGKKPTNISDSNEKDTVSANISDISGYYVDENYAKKEEGLDWVSVNVLMLDSNTIKLCIRSRADKKKPTCLIDMTGYKRGEGMYQAVVDDANVNINFKGDIIMIEAENKENEKALYFYCSGGATFAGKYSRLIGTIDEIQIDKTNFTKTLRLQNIGFHVTSIINNEKNTLTIHPFGLNIDNTDIIIDLGLWTVKDAEIEDMNVDGSPELVIYTQSNVSNKEGNVIGYSVNNKKSLSMIAFVSTKENTKINQGYRGYDEFTLVEGKLSHKFPIFIDGDKDDKPSGGTRQIIYKLADGEASRKFEVMTVTDFK